MISAKVSIMDGRALLKVDMGNYVLYRIHVLLAYRKY